MTASGSTHVKLLPRPILTHLHEGFFVLNIVCAVWYGLFDLPSTRAIFEPSSAPRFQYQFLRGALRINRLLRLEPSSDFRGNHAPLAWRGSTAGMYFVTGISTLAAGVLLYFALRCVFRSSWCSLVLKGLAGLTALFAFPLCSNVVRVDSHRAGLLAFGQDPLTKVFGFELLCIALLFYVFRRRPLSRTTMGVLMLLHYLFWIAVLWPGRALLVPSNFWPVLLIFPASGLFWLLYLKASQATPSIDSGKAGGKGILALALAVASLLFLWCPPLSRPFTPLRDQDSLLMELRMGPCFGSCPVYTLKIHGNGVVEFLANDYRGRPWPAQTTNISREKVVELVRKLDGIHFDVLDDRAFMRCADTASVGVTVSADGRSKEVWSDTYCTGARSGPQLRFVQVAEEINSELAPQNWVKCLGTPCPFRGE